MFCLAGAGVPGCPKNNGGSMFLVNFYINLQKNYQITQKNLKIASEKKRAFARKREISRALKI